MASFKDWNLILILLENGRDRPSWYKPSPSKKWSGSRRAGACSIWGTDHLHYHCSIWCMFRKELPESWDQFCPLPQFCLPLSHTIHNLTKEWRAIVISNKKIQANFFWIFISTLSGNHLRQHSSRYRRKEYRRRETSLQNCQCNEFHRGASSGLLTTQLK